MTTLQDTSVGPASQNELICPARLLLLAPSEPRAPIAILSPAKRNALVACFNAGGLHKKDGAWHGPPGGKPVSGMTTADLITKQLPRLCFRVQTLRPAPAMGPGTGDATRPEVLKAQVLRASVQKPVAPAATWLRTKP